LGSRRALDFFRRCIAFFSTAGSFSSSQDQPATRGAAPNAAPERRLHLRRRLGLGRSLPAQTSWLQTPHLDRLARMDTNHDGMLTPEEYIAGLQGAANLDQRFKNFDKNGDGKLRREEFVTPSEK